MYVPNEASSLYRLLLIADRRMRVETAQCLAKEYLTEDQYRILLAFEGTRVHTYKEIRERALTNAATLSLNMDKLDERQLVSKIPHPTHGRRTSASITDAGREVVSRIAHEVDEAHARVERAFGETQSSMLKVLLTEFVDLLGNE